MVVPFMPGPTLLTSTFTGWTIDGFIYPVMNAVLLSHLYFY